MKKILILTSTTFIILFLVVMGASYQALDHIGSRLLKSQDTQTLGVKTQQEEILPIITLTVDAGGGISSSYKLNLTADTTALSILEKAKEMGEIEFDVTQYEFGTMVNAINGFKNNKEYAWLYFVNDQAGEVSADQYLLKPGDTVQWRYTAL